MDLSPKKRMAAQVLKVGKTRVRFNPTRLDKLEDAITKDSIRNLVKEGVIWAAPKKGISRGRHRTRKRKVRRGRGPGSKEGAAGGRRGKKELWVTKVRVLRRNLKVLRDRGDITGDVFKRLFRQVKGGQIRSVRHLRELVRQLGRR